MKEQKQTEANEAQTRILNLEAIVREFEAQIKKVTKERDDLKEQVIQANNNNKELLNKVSGWILLPL